MKNGFYKKICDKNVFTDFKHHAKSWSNSKRMRSRRIRQRFKKQLIEGDFNIGGGIVDA